MLASTAPIARHAAPSGSGMKRLVPADGIVQLWGGCSSGLAPGARPLEPVATRMGSAALLA